MWAEEYVDASPDFSTSILGGAWATKHRHVEADAIKVAARGRVCNEWCVAYGLPRQASFAFRKYGEREATRLAAFWARRMQHFFDCWAVNENDDFTLTAEDIDGAPGLADGLAALGDLPATHPAKLRVAELAESLRPKPL